MSEKLDFSVVIPLMNEEESIFELYEQIDSNFKKLGKTYEIIFIDDGSTDTSLQLLKDLAQKHNNIHIYSFRRNMGKAVALTYGFKKAEGIYVLTMDADLQDDPANVEKMLADLENKNLDMVSGWRHERRDTGFKVVTSKFFNKFTSLLFGIKVHDLNCGLKLYRKEVVKELDLYGGMHRFIPVLAHELGFKIGETPITHHERKYGYSKYKPTKMLTDLPDMFTIFFLAKYNRRPLHFFGKIGGVLLGIGILILLYLSLVWLGGESIGRRPLLIFGALFVIAGIQIVFTGLLADMIANQNRDATSQIPLKYQTR